MVNNNPATVSTDYEIADKLYFEPITAEDVLHVLNFENMNKVIIQFGGQTAINLAEELEMAGVELLGSVMDTIDMLEDRDRFYQYAKEVNVPHIPGVTVEKAEEMHDRAAEIGYPVLIRPSYVIGGKGMVPFLIMRQHWTVIWNSIFLTLFYWMRIIRAKKQRWIL